MKAKLFSILVAIILILSLGGIVEAVELREGPLLGKAFNWEVSVGYSGGIPGHLYFRDTTTEYYTAELGYQKYDPLDPIHHLISELIQDRPESLLPGEDAWGLVEMRQLEVGQVVITSAPDAPLGEIGPQTPPNIYWFSGDDGDYVRGVFYGVQDQLVQFITAEYLTIWSANTKVNLYVLNTSTWNPQLAGNPMPADLLADRTDATPWIIETLDWNASGDILLEGIGDYFRFTGLMSPSYLPVGNTFNYISLADVDGDGLIGNPTITDSFQNWWDNPFPDDYPDNWQPFDRSNPGYSEIKQSWNIGQPVSFANGWIGSEDTTKGYVFEPEDECLLEVDKEGCVDVPSEPPSGNDCVGRVVSMTLKYTGEDCGASSHTQDAKKVSCDGDPAFAEPVSILVTDKKGNRIWASETDILLGESIVVDAANGGKSQLDADTKFVISDGSGAVIQEVRFHTSCSQPLNAGDQFGSLYLTSFTSTEGGEVSEPAEEPSEVCVTELPADPGAYEVEYTYMVTNTSAITTLTNVIVVDDMFGEVPGSPIASILPGETVTLTLTLPLSEETTNTVTVTGYVGNIECEASDSTTITKAEGPPPLEECTTKVRAMLLEYTGPDILGATVKIVADSLKKSKTYVVYTGVDLTAGVVLSSAEENGFTIDASAHGKNDLGAKTSIYINNVEEKIHTSCSTPFLSDAPAPLDKPVKGDPSPNWFVLEFEQKD